MSYECKIILDSISRGHRLTTLQVTFPRFILAEVNTHRMFCLAGDAELEFDLPAGTKDGNKRVYKMRLDEFVDKWLRGARRVGANPKKDVDLSWLVPGAFYTADEVASRLGMVSASNIHRLCRDGALLAKRAENGRTWMLASADILKWRRSSPEHTRFDMQAKLSGMRIRQLNEETGDIQWSHVVNVLESGEKEVFEVVAGDYRVAGSADHLVFTVRGWKRLGDLTEDDHVVVRRFGKKNADKLDPMRLKKIDGVWRCQWQRTVREEMRAQDPKCRRCHDRLGVEVHHLVPVYQDSSLTFERTNITLLCDSCHDEMHQQQDWQGGTYLYGAAVRVQAVVKRGFEKTYDLEIAGTYPNFLANGVVVHNSRNSASSRAIPVPKRVAQIEADPFVPVAFGQNKAGMQAGDTLDEMEMVVAEASWRGAVSDALKHAKHLVNAGVHKQWANRVIETYAWHTAVISATEWSNHDGLRCHPAASPEYQTIAKMMRDARAASTPREMGVGDWHLPYVEDEDYDRAILANPTHPLDVMKVLRKVSVGRCAAVSYERQEVKNFAKDVERYTNMRNGGHMSPLEHVARPMTPHEYSNLFRQMELIWNEEYEEWRWAGHGIGNGNEPASGEGNWLHYCGNVQGWIQDRKMVPNEHDFSKIARSM